MDGAYNEIDADQFLAATRLGLDTVLRGAELQKIFWRLKGLEKELERQRAFWRSTNETLSQAFEQVRAAEAELQQKNRLLSDSYAQLQLFATRLQGELALARQIQQSLLPPREAHWSGPRVTCACLPAYEVGGDFYTYRSIGDGRITLAVGDVSDKGMSAALLMAISLAYLDFDDTAALGPAALGHLDRSLVRYTEATRQNCALCYVEIDGLTLRCANAGGIPPFIRRADGRVERLDANGLPLGLGIGARAGYSTTSVDLAPHDVVVLTSDGVAEAHGPSRHLFGFDRLQQAIAEAPTTGPHAILNHLLAEVGTFVGDAEPHDDVTIVVCEVA
jgi:phosphoserine phosphatase RsbU/P